MTAGLLLTGASVSHAEEAATAEKPASSEKADHAGHDHAGHNHAAESSPAADSMAADSAASMDDGFENDIARRSYAIGMNIGQSIQADDLELDVDVLIEALQASYSGGEARMTEQQAGAVLQQLQQEMQMKQMEAQMKQQEVDSASNTEAAMTFLEENKTKEGVQVTDSGLQYQVMEEGDGPKPGPNDQVTVHYKGQLLNGEVFDSSYDRGEPATFGIDEVIPGFGEGLQLMPVGSKGKLFIPGDLAYGMRGGPGGANATLIFDVEIIDTQAPAAGKADPTDLPALGD